jgi:hypothetical protein
MATRDGWTPLQIAWADYSHADAVHHQAANLDLIEAKAEYDEAKHRLGEGMLTPKEWQEAQDAWQAAVDRIATTEQALRHAERAYWAEKWLTRRQVADLVSALTGRGINPDTWSGYVTRGQAPAPDGRDDTNHPWWSELTVRDWVASRPGQGARTGRNKGNSPK